LEGRRFPWRSDSQSATRSQQLFHHTSASPPIPNPQSAIRNMKLAVTGATGFVGRAVLKLAHQRGHEVIAFTRSPDRPIEWAAEQRPFRLDESPDLHGCESVIHLAGEPILGFWTAKKMRTIFESRVEGTRRLVEAIAKLPEKPEAFVSASATGWYGDAGDTEITEASSRGMGFLANTCAAWEGEAMKAAADRVVAVRTSVVLGRNGGAIKAMAPIFRLGLGGVIGSGRQWMSWIHLEDHARLLLFAVEDMNVRGALNASSPWPVRHEDFVKALSRVVHRPAFFHVPAFAVRLLLRGLSAELLESKRVLPAAALDYGFGFKFPELEPALRDLLS
jgi:uncharacterized protein (TIGR01777 family)